MDRMQGSFITGHLTPEEFKEAFECMDRILRPYVIFCHPERKLEIEKVVGDKAKVVESLSVPEDKVILMNREAFENPKMEVKLGYRRFL